MKTRKIKKPVLLIGKVGDLAKRAALLNNPVPDNLKDVIYVNPDKGIKFIPYDLKNI